LARLGWGNGAVGSCGKKVLPGKAGSGVGLGEGEGLGAGSAPATAKLEAAPARLPKKTRRVNE
jgi:hypothetical protein